ncbi:B12-binding domain-containing radical SAM protein [Geobacter chapellei]|uniref:B12-binding domain-containing radical SAM protein n=2 Tax=Pelotalea chapellei TaxID=44671 RepID=A0ABS5U9J0_9BACT|nr:B12-binding domain-containing radical SAM protein [Pelotalea chapellei]
MKLLLTTLHAKYSHASLALPCLATCCRDLSGIETVIREWTVNEPREQILRQIIAERADIIGFSCYIWNIEPTLQLISDIKKIAADTIIILGGPEASFNVFELMHDNSAVDFVVKGEGEKVFRKLLETVLARHIAPPESTKEIENLFSREDGDIVSGPLSTATVELDSIPSPFKAGLVELSKPLIYYETSRGCPFSCAFCLSSVEGTVRSFSPQRIESDLLFLMDRNIAQIKLVDRTFNYDARRADQIWEFILEHNQGSHFHFEIAADLLTGDNLELLRRVPPDTFRFEIGVQSTSPGTLQSVARKADLVRICDNVKRLRNETEVELHLDLVAGLPGEDYNGLLASLQVVADLNPHVIQIEPLKVLKGSPMREIARREGYRYSDSPPYTILGTPWLSFDDICRIVTIGRLLDLFHNHGGFKHALHFMQQRMSLSEFLDTISRRSAGENLSGRNTRRIYELFAHLADPLLSEAERHQLHDALFFDYCCSEMPLQGKLPAFIGDRQECAWPSRRELPDGLELPEGSRIKIFTFSFLKDYRGDKWQEGPAAVTFVYASVAGDGLRIIVA